MNHSTEWAHGHNSVASGGAPFTVFRTFAPKSSHAQSFFKLAKQKDNDLLLPKRQQQQKKEMGVTVFVLETCPENTLNVKNRASLANKATVSVSPKILQLDIWIEMFSAKYCLSVPIKWI